MPRGKREGWPSDPRLYHWIVDGHNAIFAHPELERLQTSDEKGEARRRLQQLLERFAARYGVFVHVVFDGNRLEHNPDRYRSRWVSCDYTLAPEEADDRILWMTGSLVARGERVVVVSSDRSTLGSRLPAGVLRIEPPSLFARLRGREASSEKRPPGDFADVEELLLSKEDAPEKDDDQPPPMTARGIDLGLKRAQRPTLPAGKVAHPPAGTAGSAGTPGRADVEGKRERGKRKHDRQLARRGGVQRKPKKRH